MKQTANEIINHRNEILSRTSHYSHASNAMREELPALLGTTYCYRKFKIGWVSSGMVDDAKREFYAQYYFGGAVWDRKPTEEKASQVAYMPYCITNTNFMTIERIACDAVEVFAK